MRLSKFFVGAICLPALLTFSARAQQAVDTSIVAQYHCDEGQDTILHDSGPFHNDIILHNITWTNGVLGHAIAFNGINSYGVATEGRPGSLDFGTGDFSVGLWVKTQAFDASTKYDMVSKGDPFNTGYTVALHPNGSPNTIAADFVGATGFTIGVNTAQAAINDNKWHYVVCTRNAGVVNLYVDALIVNTYTWNGTVTVSTSLFLGKHGINNADFLVGTLDEITLYKRALSGAEISSGLSLAPAGPVPSLIPVPSPTYYRQPTFRWHPVVGQSTYLIEIDSTLRFQTPLVYTPVADTSFIPLAPLPIGPIYWRVARDSAVLIYSAIGTFTIIDSSEVILIPYTPDPTLERRPTLCWHRVAKADSYSLLVANSSGFAAPLISVQVADTFFQPLVDLPIGNIIWEVKSDSSSRYSIPDAFTVQSDTVPFLYRFNGAVVDNRRPSFKWHPVNQANSYTLQIDTAGNFSSPLYVLQLADTVFTPYTDLNPGQTYHWRVSCSRNSSLFSPQDTVTIDVALAAGRLAFAGTQRQLVRTSHNRIDIDNRASMQVSVHIYNLLGKRVLCQEYGSNMTHISVALHDMPSGLYLCSVKMGNATISDIISVAGKMAN